MSLPSRERGLKSPQLEHIRPTAKVAPLAGAWIEILYFLQRYCVFFVAPLAGAWIEMLCNMYKNEQTLSLPSRERGLKLCRDVITGLEFRRSPRGSVD